MRVMFTSRERKAPRNRTPTPAVPTPAAPASRPPLEVGRQLRDAGARAKARQAPALEGSAQPHWRVTILPGHGHSLGTHQKAQFEAAVWTGELSKERRTDCHWTLKRDKGASFETVKSGTGHKYQVDAGLAPGQYVMECTLVQTDSPHPSKPHADALAVGTRPHRLGTPRLRFPPPEASGQRDAHQPGTNEAHSSNPYVGGPWYRFDERGPDGTVRTQVQGSAEQAAQDSMPVGAAHETVVARDEYQFTVSSAEDYTRALLDRHKEELPLGSLEEELQLLPEQNADNAASISPDKSAVGAKSAALRDAVNLPNIFPKMGNPADMGSSLADSDRSVTRIHAALSQNDSKDVHLRLFMATMIRGTERFIRIVELPPMNTPEDANRVRAYNGRPFEKPDDVYGSFMTAMQEYAEKCPHGFGTLRFEVEGHANLSGTLQKGASELALAAENIDQLAEITKLLAMIPPISTPMGIATVLLSAGSASLKAADQYNRGEDNTEAAADAVVSLLEFGGGLAPKGRAKEVLEASKRLVEGTRNAVGVTQALANHEKVDPGKGLAILKDALAFGRVVTPDVFAPGHYSVGTRRVIVQLSHAYQVGEKVVKYVNLPEDLSQKFTELANTEGLSDNERRLRAAKLVADALK